MSYLLLNDKLKDIIEDINKLIARILKHRE